MTTRWVDVGGYEEARGSYAPCQGGPRRRLPQARQTETPTLHELGEGQRYQASTPGDTRSSGKNLPPEVTRGNVGFVKQRKG